MHENAKLEELSKEYTLELIKDLNLALKERGKSKIIASSQPTCFATGRYAKVVYMPETRDEHHIAIKIGVWIDPYYDEDGAAVYYDVYNTLSGLHSKKHVYPISDPNIVDYILNLVEETEKNVWENESCSKDIV